MPAAECGGGAAAWAGGIGVCTSDGSTDVAVAERVACVAELEAAARAFGVDRAWAVKPLLNGPQVSRMGTADTWASTSLCESVHMTTSSRELVRIRTHVCAKEHAGSQD